ncbi:MAG: PBP1A family penicillin-binding protein [Patescibacteria group bacterium]
MVKTVVKDQAFYRSKQRRFMLTIILAFISFFVLVPFITYFYFAPDLSSKETIMNRNDSGVILLDRNNKPFFSFYQAKFKSFVPLNNISVYEQHAVVAIEDKDFYNHPGFSVRSIVRAFVANFSHGDIKQGGSTITQQLVKNAILTSKKSYGRKYQELVLAQEIERKYSKQEILEMYLNSVYFGEGAVGVGQAAEVYYNKDAKDLTLAESAMLAGLLPSPSRYSPISGDAVMAKSRQLLVLQDMLAQGYITKDQYNEARQEKLTYNTTKDTINNIAPHFALMVRDELIKNFGEEEITRSGFKVKTTLDSSWQEFAETTVKEGVDKLANNKVTNGAAVVMDPKTGQIKALVGSKDWYDESFGKVNMATSPRQPGSSFKPVVYSDALQKEIITPGTILHDTPTTFPGGYKPLDYDKKTRGNVNLRRALANSLNIPAVEVMVKVGVPEILDFAKEIGITTLGDDASNYGNSLVLGAGEIPLVQMTNVYAMFANGGKHNDPVTILEIKDKQEVVSYSASVKPEQVLHEGAAFIISSILSDNTAKQETFGNALANRYNSAVKTGTTDNYRDALTIGYKPNIAVGVWVGNNDNTPMDQVAGALGPAPIWRTLIDHYLAELPTEEFVAPSSVVRFSVCSYKTTKEKDGDKEKEKVTVTTTQEYFIAGTEPKNGCQVSVTPSPSESITPSPASPSPNQPTATPSPAPTKGETPTPTVTQAPQPTATPSPTISIPVSPSPTP